MNHHIRVVARPGTVPYDYRNDSGLNAQHVHGHKLEKIRWFVQTVESGKNRRPPYRLIFNDPSIFDDPVVGQTGVLDVPLGGWSRDLEFVVPFGHTKYTVDISGVTPVDDPEIQIGIDFILPVSAVFNFPLPADLYTFQTPAAGGEASLERTSSTGETNPPVGLEVPVNIPVGSLLRWTVPGGAGKFKVTFPLVREHPIPSPLRGIFENEIPGGALDPAGKPSTAAYTVRNVDADHGDATTSFSFTITSLDTGVTSPAFSFNVVEPLAQAV